MTSPSSPEYVKSGKSLRWRNVRRLAAIALVGIAGALFIDALAVVTLHVRRPPPPRISAVFASAAAVRELQAMVADNPDDPEWHARLGQVYLQDGHFLSAIESFQEALRRHGPESVLRRALAACYNGLDRNEDALNELRRLAELDPLNLAVRLQMAAEWDALGKRRHAIQILDEIPRDDTGYPRLNNSDVRYDAMEQLAVAYAQMEDWPRCLELSLHVLKDRDDRLSAHAIAGKALLQLQRPKEAATHLRTALRGNPDHPEIQFLLAESMLGSKDFKNDDEICRLLESVTKKDIPERGRASFELGLRYENRKQWAKAAQAFMQAYLVSTQTLQSLRHAYENYGKAGNVEQALYVEGMFYETQDLYDKAIAVYSKLTKIHSCCQSGYMHVARVQAQRGEPRVALATLTTAMKVSPPPPKLYAEMAKLYGSLKDLKNEQAMWREFIRRDNENADLGYQNLGSLADSGGNLKEAEEKYRKCVELHPESELYRVRLARILLQQRSDPAKLREAVSQLERAVRLSRSDPEICFQLGVAYRYAGRTQESIWALRHAIDLDPGDGRPYQPLAEVLLASGKQEEGKRTMQLFRRFRQFHQAWETLLARTKRDPKDVNAQRRLAAFYERSGAKLNAIHVYATILQLRPDDQRIRDRLVTLYREVGQDPKDIGAISK